MPIASTLLLRAVALVATVLAATIAPGAAQAEDHADAAMAERIQALIPRLEGTIADGMKAFDTPGLAIGIVANDRLVYSKGFGVRSKSGGAPVDTRTVFQIGSTTKGFLAATLAIMVDRGKLRWDDRVADRDADFQLKDPWVTREFRIFDLLAQRSGLPTYANDALAMLGLDEAALIRSLRHVEPVTSFRSTFTYTNITHLLAGRIVAKAAGAPDWNAVLRQELIDPLGMSSASTSAEAIEAAPNHAQGYRWTPGGTIEVPFTPLFPYSLGGAGNINASLEDAVAWLRLQLGGGSFEGRRIVSADNLAATYTPKVAMSERMAYALGWVIQQTPNGRIVWHNGGTTSFGAYIGMVSDRNVGVVVLTNAVNLGLPDAIGEWTLDRLMGNAEVDHVASKLKAAKATFAAAAKVWAKPASPRPFPLLDPLAGRFANASIGAATLAAENGTLVLTLAASGAKLKLAPWDGDVLTATVVPQGRFAAVAENIGPQPAAFAQMLVDKAGKLDVLRLMMDDGQAYDFRRE
jgi:CubicO group peptidase (beta-lactamase class C family)